MPSPLGISTLGPCAEAMGLSAMMVFCVGVAQLPVMIGLAMHVPSVRVDLYSPYLDVAMDPSTNQSAVVIPTPVHRPTGGEGYEQQQVTLQVNAAYMHGINISGLFILCASSFTFFVVLTMQFVDRGLRSSGNNSSDGGLEVLMASFQEEFIAQNAGLVGDPSFRLWNQSFVVAILLLHLVATATVCSPVSSHMLLSTGLLFFASLGRLVHPLDNFDSANSENSIGLSSLASQKVMILGGTYLAAVSLVLANIVVDVYYAKVQAILLLAFLDSFMLFGHLWDRVPILQVIINCRLLYVTLLVAFNAGMLCMWDPFMKTNFYR